VEPKTGIDPRSLLEHRGFVRAIVRGILADEHAVEDIVQETCLRALERPPRTAAIRSWLTRVGRNLALTARRREKSRLRRERAGARPESQPAASEAAVNLEQLRLVVEAVLALEEPFRSAILLRFYEDLPPKEIARELGVPVDTVRSRLRRGLERMRAWFDEKHGGDRSAWSLALLPILGARGGAAATKVLLLEGLMSAKTKLVGAALVVCLVGAGTVAWHAAKARDRAPPPRAEALRDVAPPTQGEDDTPVSRPPEPPRFEDSAAPDPVRTVNAEVRVGRGKAQSKPYRLAEASGGTDTGALRVLVTDPSGNTIPGITVCVTSEIDGRWQATMYEPDATGRLEVRPLEPGQHGVHVRNASGRTRDLYVEIEAGRFSEVALELAPGATIEGTVRHVERGVLAGIEVSLSRRDGPFQDSFSATTDAEGRFRLVDVPPGVYPVSLKGTFIGYDGRPRAEFTVNGLGTVRQDVLLGRVVLSGTVRDEETGAPLPGVKLSVYQAGFFAEATTDPNGAYSFLDLVPGDHGISCAKEGYAGKSERTGGIPAEGTRVTDFTMRRAAVLVVEVRDRDGRPVAGHHTLLLFPVSPPGMESTGGGLDFDSKGVGRYTQVLPGTYNLALTAEGFLPAKQRVEVKEGESRVSVVLERAKEERRPSLEGTVRDAVTGEPLAGTRVCMQRPLSHTTNTDADGVYRFYGVSPGPCELYFSIDGYGIQWVKDFDLEEGKGTLDLDLLPAATLRLEVTGPDGRPVSGRLILGVIGRGEGTTNVGTGVEADAEGHAVCRQIVPGRYQLHVTKESLGSARVEVEIVPGENVVRARLE